MTLRRKLVTQLSLLLLCLTATAGVGLSGVNGLNTNYGVALRGYEEQRRLYQIAYHLSTARLLLSIDFPDVQAARREAGRARQLLQPRAGGKQSVEDAALVASLAVSIERMGERRPDARTLNVPLGRLDQRIEDVRTEIEGVERAAREKRNRSLLLMACVAGLSGLGAIMVSVRGYRSVIGPLTRFSVGVHRVASGRFDERIDARADTHEFARLADDFNLMAAELQASYQDLHERVEARTRQLVRSERLAGVGFLAAGVAHEINNPLGIISGYAELWLADPDGESASKTITIARDEAFRCKEIVDRLLALARSPTATRQAVRLDRLAAEVAGLLNGLPRQRENPIELENSVPACAVNGDIGELKQLLLNLCINGLEATGEAKGSVTVGLTAASGVVELSVTDTGRGMSPEQLKRAFEPFFTDRPDGTQRGLGLGLSISHAIVESHGGTIDAHSEGPGKGSRFIVRLPADPDAASDA